VPQQRLYKTAALSYRNRIETEEEMTDEASLYKRKYHDTVVALGEVLSVETEDGQKENVVDALLSKVKITGLLTL